MTYATAGIVQGHHGHHQGTVHQVQQESCSNCNDNVEPLAKFCGSCGFIVAPNSFNFNQYAGHAYQIDREPATGAEEAINGPAAAVAPAMPVSFAFAQIPKANPRA